MNERAARSIVARAGRLRIHDNEGCVKGRDVPAKGWRNGRMTTYAGFADIGEDKPYQVRRLGESNREIPLMAETRYMDSSIVIRAPRDETVERVNRALNLLEPLPVVTAAGVWEDLLQLADYFGFDPVEYAKLTGIIRE